MKSILWTRKSLLPTLLALFLSIVMVSVGTASPTPSVTQTNSTTMVYLDPATINGTAIGIDGTVTVNINIIDAVPVYSWQAGLVFDATLLECLEFKEGDFLSNFEGPSGTLWIPALINNTAGVIDACGCTFQGEAREPATGDGQLAYLTFKVKAPGVSNIHLRDIMVMDYYEPKTKMIPFNIIDVYTVPPHTVVMVSNSSGFVIEYDYATGEYVYYHSGFYNYGMQEKKISFNVDSGPSSSFSNISIPKALLEPEPTYTWGVVVDDSPIVDRTVKDNATHTSIYFTYSKGDHEVQINTLFLTSTISIEVSSTSVNVGSSITISGGITPARSFVTVTIEYRKSGAVAWTTLGNKTTNQDGEYTYDWKTDKAGTYEVRARWDGDETYAGDASEPQLVEVKGKGIPLEMLMAVVGGIVVVVVILVGVYFVKVRKAKPE